MTRIVVGVSVCISLLSLDMWVFDTFSLSNLVVSKKASIDQKSSTYLFRGESLKKKSANEHVGKQNQKNPFVWSYFNTVICLLLQKLVIHLLSGKRLSQVLAKLRFQEKQPL